MGKQMEGDNRHRRQRARQARQEGRSASEEGTTLGASKQDYHLARSADHHQKMAAPGRGKQQPKKASNPMRPGSSKD
jgi:hypothetical protein